MNRRIDILSSLCILALVFFIHSYFAPAQSKPFAWETVRPAEVKLEEEYLDKLVGAIKDSSNYAIDGLIVVRHGKIAVEEYYNGFGRDSLHNTASVGKSITSALTGIAIEKGLIPDRKVKIMECFKEAYPNQASDSLKNGITVEHILSMSSGLACNGWDDSSPGGEWHLPDAADDFAHILTLPMLHKPGEKFSYCTGGANLLGEIIRMKSGKSLKAYADENLFGKIGIKENKWFIVPKPPYYEYSGGGNRLRPRDMARFGLLYLNKGLWQGEQVVPTAWVEESTSRQMKTPDGESYGYFWW